MNQDGCYIEAVNGTVHNGEPEEGFWGFVDFVENFIPSSKEKGVSAEEIKQMTCTNPNRVFEFQIGV